jgi:hypothetical protein
VRGGTARRGASKARPPGNFVLLAFVAVGVMAAYLAVQRGVNDTWDGKAMSSVALNLLQHGSLKECCHAFGAYPKDPGPYAMLGIGYSALLAPLWHFQLQSNRNGALWLGLANPLLLTATTLVIAKTGLVLGWRRSSAVLSALAFALLTMAPLYSNEFFSEPGVTFGSSLLMLGFVVWQQRVARGALLIGVGTAVAILFRPDSIMLLGPTVPLMVLFHSRDHLIATWRSWIPRLGVPIGLALAWTLFYDNLRYGNPFQVGYSNSTYSFGFSTPLIRGVALLLWSPGKSFFVFSPILIAAIPGLVLLARRRRALVVVIVVLFVLRVGFYARWFTPAGGNSWGPRFLLPLCAVLAIPLGETIEHLHVLRARARRAAVGVLGVLAATSVVVQLSSLLVSYRDIYVGTVNVSLLPPSIQRTAYAQQEHGFAWIFGNNQIIWNLKHVGSKQFGSPLYWFQHGATRFGVAMLALAAIMCSGAVLIASLSDRSEQHLASMSDGPAQ